MAKRKFIAKKNRANPQTQNCAASSDSDSSQIKKRIKLEESHKRKYKNISRPDIFTLDTNEIDGSSSSNDGNSLGQQYHADESLHSENDGWKLDGKATTDSENESREEDEELATNESMFSNKEKARKSTGNANSGLEDDSESGPCEPREEFSTNNRMFSKKKNRKSIHNEDKVTHGKYTGFQSFMNSFQFFSDDENEDDEKDVKFKKKNFSNRSSNQSRYSFTSNLNIPRNNLEENLQIDHEKIKSLQQNWFGQEVIIFDCPTIVQLRGHLQVLLLFGKASVCGYELKLHEPVTLISQKQTGLISIESQCTNTFNSSNTFDSSTLKMLASNILNSLSGMPNSAIMKFISSNIHSHSTVVFLKELELPSPLRFLGLYHPEAVPPRLPNTAGPSLYATTLADEIHNLTFPKEKYDTAFRLISSHLFKINKGLSPNTLNSSLFKDSDSSDYEDMEIDEKVTTDCENMKESRIFICGPKKSGKSTLLRYLINKFLNKYQEVFYLDTDPGQTEFTPPGVISLNKITEPVLGPPYCHLKDPVKMVYTGTITAETSPPMHTRAVQYLIDYFNKNFPKSILLVNTFGRYEGLGEMIIEIILNIVKPTVHIELTSDLLPCSSTLNDGVLNIEVGFNIDAHISTGKGDHRPADLRNFALLSYFGKSQQDFLQPTYLNAMRPMCISWDEIAVYNFNKRLPYNRYYEALNCSIVALCHVEDCYMLEPTSPEYPNTLDDEPINDCLGFGFVRAVDEDHHLLYIITPLEWQALSKVNALLSGNILVPRSVILDQPIGNKGLPYTDNSEEGQTSARKSIKRRSRFNLEAHRRSLQTPMHE